jgi:hypothetical protein
MHIPKNPFSSPLVDYSPRIRAFRSLMIAEIPRVPNNRASREFMENQPTSWLISAFVTWRMRYIPSKPRTISLWSGGVTPLQFRAAKSRLRPLLQKVETGRDLRPHLSYLVDTKGVILPGASSLDKGKDIDAILTRYGIHHFHVGEISASNPKGRSGILVFAEVLEKEFRIVTVTDHRAFKLGSIAQRDFSAVCISYIAKDIAPGSGLMLNPVMSSGRSSIVMLFALKCEREIRRIDSLLDDSEFIESIYNKQQILRDGLIVRRPEKPSLAWHFEDLQFGILDKRTMVFFNIFPFFAR